MSGSLWRLGGGWLCVALNAPLHIKRLVSFGDLFVQNTAPPACGKRCDGLFLPGLFPAHEACVKLLIFEKEDPPYLKNEKRPQKSQEKLQEFLILSQK